MGIATRLGTENVLSFNMLEITDYGRPMKPFFIELLGLGKQIGQINFGAFGVISAEISVSTNFGTVSPLSKFSIIQPLYLQKTKFLHPHPK